MKEDNLKKIATLCAAAAMLAVPATASAETIKQTGEIVGSVRCV